VKVPPVILLRTQPARWWLAGGVAAALGVWVLFRFDPVRYAFYPRCLFHATTGLHCPGCGALRGVHELLHGHWLTALRLNALVFGWLPLLFVGWCWRCWRERERMQADLLRLSARSGWWMLGALLAFGVLRNLPVYPCTLLAP
jgi:hypothetical protein